MHITLPLLPSASNHKQLKNVCIKYVKHNSLVAMTVTVTMTVNVTVTVIC